MTLSKQYADQLARILSAALSDVVGGRCELPDGQARLAACVLGSPRPFEATQLAVGAMDRVVLRAYGAIPDIPIKPAIGTLDEHGRVVALDIDTPELWYGAAFVRSIAMLHAADAQGFCAIIDGAVQGDVDRARRLLDFAFAYACSAAATVPCTCGMC